MDVQEYIASRLDEQIKFYSKRSQSAKSSYFLLTILQIFLAALLPVIATSKMQTLLSGTQEFLVSSIGIIIVISTGLLNLNKYQEKWVNYRKTAEKLKQEKYIFLSQRVEYQQSHFQDFVNKIERLHSGEIEEWANKVAARPVAK